MISIDSQVNVIYVQSGTKVTKRDGSTFFKFICITKENKVVEAYIPKWVKLTPDDVIGKNCYYGKITEYGSYPLVGTVLDRRVTENLSKELTATNQKVSIRFIDSVKFEHVHFGTVFGYFLPRKREYQLFVKSSNINCDRLGVDGNKQFYGQENVDVYELIINQEFEQPKQTEPYVNSYLIEEGIDYEGEF